MLRCKQHCAFRTRIFSSKSSRRILSINGSLWIAQISCGVALPARIRRLCAITINAQDARAIRRSSMDNCKWRSDGKKSREDKITLTLLCRWWWFKHWQTKYFALSNNTLIYGDGALSRNKRAVGRHMKSSFTSAILQGSLRHSKEVDLRSIREVRTLSQRRRRRRSLSGTRQYRTLKSEATTLPRTFEIFTDTQPDPVVLKARERLVKCDHEEITCRLATASKVYNGCDNCKSLCDRRDTAPTTDSPSDLSCSRL